MEFASPLIELVKCLWGLARKPLCSMYNLKDNVDLLRNETEDLKAKSEDVKARVKREEDGGGVQRTEQVKNWLDKVQAFVGGIDQVLQEIGDRDQIKCLSHCLPRNCQSSYQLGERVDRMLIALGKLKEEQFDNVTLTLPLPPPRVLEMPMDETVALDIYKFNKVWKWLVDEKQVGVIGLYGIGGVGKTTLMKRINNELFRTNYGFDVVIWVVVSRQVNEDRIQDTIRKRLTIRDEHWERWSSEDRVHHLCEVLTKKKFMLLIDDVWAWLDLSKIGVPHPGLENGSKVVFTTRSEQVCNQMEADKTLEVQCLAPEKALELFEKYAGKSLVDCDQEIRDLAKDITEECKGLPLALKTVGRAIGSKDNPREWRHALTTLRNRPHELSVMVNEVYHILEFSYKSLDDPTLQACFLYCCLFPEDYPIKKDELIELWIGEGLLGGTDDVYRMRDKGESILGDLKRACLLESGYDCYRAYVKMHDVIRDMATWIACDHGQKENKLLMIEKEEDMSAKMISKRGEAEKLSLWGKWIQNINPTLPRCSQLETLLVRETNVMDVPRGFFDSMAALLTVLDLSNNINIKFFPEEICNLINLQYLNLSTTWISALPGEIKNLTCLRWLLLDNMPKDVLIPTGAIASLPLNVFSEWESIDWDLGLVNEEETVKELGSMQHLTDLSIIVSKSSSVMKIFQSPNFRRSVRRVMTFDVQEELTSIVINYSPADGGGFPHLEVLDMRKCTALREMKIAQGIGRAPNCSCFPSLVEVQVTYWGPSDLSWLVHAPNLRILTVAVSDSMEKIIGDGFAPEELAASRLFSRLERIELSSLPILTSICDQTLSFRQGVLFDIQGCPRLTKLPLDSNSRRGSFSVRGYKDWWAKFEGDPTARVTLELDVKKEETTFGEAVRKMKDESIDWATIEF